MKFGYALTAGILFLAASSVVVLGQTPGKTDDKMGGMRNDKMSQMHEKMAGQMGGHMSGMMNQDEAAKTLAVMDHIWLDAAHNRDTGTMEWLFAKDFVEIHPGGEIVDGPTQIAQIKEPSRSINEIHPDDIKVLYVTGDTGIVLDTTTIRGESGGVKYDGTFKVIRVFVREQGRWRAAGAGIAPIQK